MLELSLADWLTVGGHVLTLVFLEGLLSADNALVLAIMVRHLPRVQQKRALRYGIAGAFFFRLVAVLLASQILDYWQFEVIGGGYLLYLALKHLLGPGESHSPGDTDAPTPAVAGRGFWATVIGVELTDVAFSIDSILAAVAVADNMPEHLQAVDLGWVGLKSLVIYIGGVLGIITMRYVAGYFILLLDRFPGLARGAYYLVGWIGLKLIGSGLHHALFRSGQRLHGGWRDLIPIPESLAHYLEMPPVFFWGGMLAILVVSMLAGPRRRRYDPAESLSPAPALKRRAD